MRTPVVLLLAVFASSGLVFSGADAPVRAQAPASAQAPVVTPQGPITIVSPFPAGGGVDAVARLIADRLQVRFGQTVMVENRAGAAGAIGLDYAARAPADGRTLVLFDMSATLLKWLQKSVPFDVNKDFSPIALVCAAPLVLFAHPSAPGDDVNALVAYAKANPGKLSLAIPGVGTPHHLAAAMFNSVAKVDITHVPYRGTAPALTDVLAGQVPLMWAAPVIAKPYLDKGQTKAFAVSAPRRLASMPAVPTIAETGLPAFEVEAWYGLAGPAGMSPDLVTRLSEEMRLMALDPAFQKRFDAIGYELRYRDSRGFGALIAGDHEKYGAVIRQAGLAPN